MKEQYRVAAYCRLSREDGDKTESDSIVNQRHIIEDFCKKERELAIAETYQDDGYTGTNFERPAFRRMLGDIESGRINCVIVKDLSRFGRDYIDMGFYLERYFPEKGVRFIAVNDGVDSRRGPYDMLLPLKNVFNAQYAKDTSDKVRKSFRAKQERGEFVGAFAPYGYAKAPNDKNRFVIDPPAAENVRRIFELKADGQSYMGIARELNRACVPSPIEYKRNAGMRLRISSRTGGALWSDTTVRRILNNEAYLGSMVSNRFSRDGMHGKQRAVPRSEWIVAEGMHEPVVSRRLWAAAHARMPEAAAQGKERGNSLFGGFLRCGDCGRALVCKDKHGRVYVCSAYKAYGKNACARHAIKESELSEIILADLNRLVARVDNIEELLPKNGDAADASRDAQREAERVKTAIARLRRQKQGAYEAYRAGRITREEYARRKAAYDKEENELAEKTPAKPKRRGSDQDQWTLEVREKGRIEKLDRKTLEQTVKEVSVFADGRMEISYFFAREAVAGS